MRIGVDTTIFARFPGYRRAIILGRGLDNRGEHPELQARLGEAAAALRESAAGSDWRAEPRIAVWLHTFTALGVGPGSKPPSVAALAKRVVKGGSPPFISRLVALMNIVSLENLVPCGGDDLAEVGDEILLRPAVGTERYSPLGDPNTLEHPSPGEIIYVDTSSDNVLCRCWCWRNSDVTRITESTTQVCLNLDLMAPAMDPGGDEALAATAADDMRRYCGGEVTWHLLTAESPLLHVDA